MILCALAVPSLLKEWVTGSGLISSLQMILTGLPLATSDDTVVGVIPFPMDDWHWAAALEFWLIDVDPRPKFNQKF